MLEKTEEDIKNQERYNSIIKKVGPDVEYMFGQFKNVLGGKLPMELCFGMVAGYLHGRGFTWEESFAGANRYIQIIESLTKPETINGTMTISAQEDGNAKIELKES